MALVADTTSSYVAPAVADVMVCDSWVASFETVPDCCGVPNFHFKL